MELRRWRVGREGGVGVEGECGAGGGDLRFEI